MQFHFNRNYAAGTAATPNTGYFAGGDPAPGNSQMYNVLIMLMILQ